MIGWIETWLFSFHSSFNINDDNNNNNNDDDANNNHNNSDSNSNKNNDNNNMNNNNNNDNNNGGNQAHGDLQADPSRGTPTANTKKDKRQKWCRETYKEVMSAFYMSLEKPVVNHTGNTFKI